MDQCDKTMNRHTLIAVSLISIMAIATSLYTFSPFGASGDDKKGHDAPPTVPEGDETIYTVTMVDDNRGYAGGQNGLLYEYNGTAWTRLETPTSMPIRDIEVDGEEIWISTCHIAGHQRPGGIHRYDGETWHDLGQPDFGYIDIDLVNGTLWATGHRHRQVHEPFTTETIDQHTTGIYRYGGDQWVNTLPDTPGELTAISFDENGGYATGMIGDHNDVMLTWTGSEWNQTELTPQDSLTHFTDIQHTGDEIVAAGFPIRGNTSIVTGQGKTWQRWNRTIPLQAISEDGRWIVGEDGTLIDRSGQQPTDIDPPTDRDLYGIETHDSELWISGANRTLLHNNGTTWTNVTLP